MMSYKDRTYCTFHKECEKGKDCPRALTEKVQEDAEKWWGKDNPPICIFGNTPKCFQSIKKEV